MRPVFSLMLAACDGSAIEAELREAEEVRDAAAEHAERHAAMKYQSAFSLHGLFRDPDEHLEPA